MDSKVSIIIPCWNQAQYLSDAIESALNQTIPCEVIVVNDGSPDNTSEIAKRYPVILIEKENGGLSSARNDGIKVSKGEWILTLDADDKIAPDFIEKTIGKDDIVSCYQQEFGDSSNLWKQPKLKLYYEDFFPYNRINCCSLYKKEIWEKVGGYSYDMKKTCGMEGYEDWLFWTIATKLGYTVTIIPEALFFYRKHGNSMVTGAIDNHDKLYKYILEQNGLLIDHK